MKKTIDCWLCRGKSPIYSSTNYLSAYDHEITPTKYTDGSIAWNENKGYLGYSKDPDLLKIVGKGQCVKAKITIEI